MLLDLRLLWAVRHTTPNLEAVWDSCRSKALKGTELARPPLFSLSIANAFFFPLVYSYPCLPFDSTILRRVHLCVAPPTRTVFPANRSIVQPRNPLDQPIPVLSTKEGSDRLAFHVCSSTALA